jgi:hypothetical protein
LDGQPVTLQIAQCDRAVAGQRWLRPRSSLGSPATSGLDSNRVIRGAGAYPSRENADPFAE